MKFLREPLLHFLLAGGLLFAWDALRAGPSVGAGELRVSAGQIEHLAEVFARTWQRQPTQEELAGLIQEHLREEVAYREALALGLDRDDTIVRRRLRQKLEFLAEDITAQARPTDEELAALLAAHPARFRHESRTSFSHLYFSPERRADPAAHARAALAELALGAPAEELGDPTLLPLEFEDVTERDVDAQFGEGFAHAIAALPMEVWAGPLESPFGQHLVLIQTREPGRPLELAEARARVEEEWQAERREREREAFYAALLQRYRLVIEPFPAMEGAR